MRFSRGRLRRLENRDRAEDCRECYLEPQTPRVFYPGEGGPRPSPERCQNCGRLLGPLIAVAYEDEEGEGAE